MRHVLESWFRWWLLVGVYGFGDCLPLLPALPGVCRSYRGPPISPRAGVRGLCIASLVSCLCRWCCCHSCFTTYFGPLPLALAKCPVAVTTLQDQAPYLSWCSMPACSSTLTARSGTPLHEPVRQVAVISCRRRRDGLLSVVAHSGCSQWCQCSLCCPCCQWLLSVVAVGGGNVVSAVIAVSGCFQWLLPGG